ncbi:hypothetical protein M405DRAFT_212263 [Rhizopogon salebrosus TDB-379]|nr:hypothetical protein M405DRAFT_212263 [Rhizopogon salebrosus TDB-379]
MSSSTPDFLLQIDIQKTFGPLFLGVILAAVLFGLTNVQAFIYFQSHRRTGMTLYKLVVIWLWILDALHLALIIHCVYYYLVISYANINLLDRIVWSFKLQVVIAVVIIYGVHILYVYRIWIVSKGRSRILPIAVGIIVNLALGVAMALMWAIYHCPSLTHLVGIEWATYMTLGTMTFGDFVIASSLCYFLATSRTGFSGIDFFLTKLMVYTINTGCLTSVCSVAAIITCALLPGSLVFLGLEFLTVKLYVNSFLALLNARYYTQSTAEPIDSSGFHACRTPHDIHRPEQDIRESRHDKLASQENTFGHPDEEPHPTHPVQTVLRPLTLTMEMGISAFSPV